MNESGAKVSSSEWFMEIEREGIPFQVVVGEPGLNYGNFWSLFVADWEPMTLKWIKELGNPNKAFLDIGSWIGPTSLWASKFFRTVHAYEPDPVAFKYLEQNAMYNAHNIRLSNAAITSDGKPVSLFSRGGLGSSMTSMYTGEKSDAGAAGMKLSDALRAEDFGVIKIDIEGGERLIIDSLVEEMASNPIDLIFAFHYEFFANPREDFNYTRDALKTVYSKFVLENGREVEADDIPAGFITVLCTK